MMDFVRSWVMELTGAALVAAVALAVTPEGRVKKVVTLVCGLVMILALMSPVMRFDFTSFSKNISEYRQTSEDFSSKMKEVNNDLTRHIIEEKCAAYILDKGKKLGLNDLKATVSAKWSEEGYWYPYKVTLSSKGDKEKRRQITSYIESELGIPQDMQIWGTNDES